MPPIFKLVFIVGTLKLSFIVKLSPQPPKRRCNLVRICTLHFAMKFKIKHLNVPSPNGMMARLVEQALPGRFHTGK
jgi:hypothetical protein